MLPGPVAWRGDADEAEETEFPVGEGGVGRRLKTQAEPLVRPGVFSFSFSPFFFFFHSLKTLFWTHPSTSLFLLAAICLLSVSVASFLVPGL